MSYTSINSPLRDPSSPCHAAAVETAATMRKLKDTTAKVASAAPKTDVITMSCRPTHEQAERLRGVGILGYGSVSASKQVAAAGRWDGTGVIRFTVDYQSEYFDLVNKTTVRHASTGIGMFASDGSSAQGITAQVSFTSLESWPEQLERTADVLAAAYQTKLSYLSGRFSGEELERRAASLAESYQTAKDTAADSIAGLLGRFLEPKDRAVIDPEIRSGVLGLFARCEEKYSSAVKEQKDSVWLGATLYESTVELMMGTCSQYAPPELSEDGSWDLAEYRHASVTISAYQAIISAALSGNGTESQLLAKFDQVSMKAEEVTIGGRSPGVTELFRVSKKNAYLELLTAIGRDPSRREGFSVRA